MERVVDRHEEATRRGALTAQVTENGQTRALPLRVVEPGVHDAQLEIAADRDAVIEVKDRKGKVVARHTVVRPPSVEMRQRGPDDAALAAIATATGGKVAPASVAPTGGAAIRVPPTARTNSMSRFASSRPFCRSAALSTIQRANPPASASSASTGV